MRQPVMIPSGDNNASDGGGGNASTSGGDCGRGGHPAEAFFRSFDLTGGSDAPPSGPSVANNDAPSSTPFQPSGPAPQAPQLPQQSRYYPLPFARLPLMNFLGSRSSNGGNNGNGSSNLTGLDLRQQHQQQQLQQAQQFQQEQLRQFHQQHQWQMQLQQFQFQQHQQQQQQEAPQSSGVNAADRPEGGCALRPAVTNALGNEALRGHYYLPPPQTIMYPVRFNEPFPQAFLLQRATSQGSIDVNQPSSSSASLNSDDPRSVTPLENSAPPGISQAQQVFAQQQQHYHRQAQLGGAVVRGRAEFLLPSTHPMLPSPRLPPGLGHGDMLHQGDFSGAASGGGGGNGGGGLGSARSASGSMVVAQKLSEMPKFKKRPIGRTGHRFILEHSFVTKSGNTYSGFSLQYPKVFGFRSEKSKDMDLLVSNRNAKMTRWAELNTTLDADAISAWVAALDEGGAGATGGN